MIARTPRRRDTPHPGERGPGWKKVPAPGTELWEEPAFNYEFAGPPDPDAPEDVRRAWGESQRLLSAATRHVRPLSPEEARKQFQLSGGRPSSFTFREIDQLRALVEKGDLPEPEAAAIQATLEEQHGRLLEALAPVREMQAQMQAMAEGVRKAVEQTTREVYGAFARQCAEALRIPILSPDIAATLQRVAEAASASHAVQHAQRRPQKATRPAAERHQRAPRRQRSAQRRAVRRACSSRGDPPSPPGPSPTHSAALPRPRGPPRSAKGVATPGST
jgi:hypothetical protein